MTMTARLLSMSLLLTTVAVGSLGAQQRPAYLDESLPFEQRARDLVSRLTLEEKAMQMKDVAPAIARLGIPEYNWWNEALHGVARAGLATVFPQAIGVAATWDDSAMFQVENEFQPRDTILGPSTIGMTKSVVATMA